MINMVNGWFYHSNEHSLAAKGVPTKSIKERITGIMKKGTQIGAGAFTGMTAAGLVSGLSQLEMQNAEIIASVPMEAKVAILAAELGGMAAGYVAMGKIEQKLMAGKSLSEREKELVELIKKKWNEEKYRAPNPFAYGG